MPMKTALTNLTNWGNEYEPDPWKGLAAGVLAGAGATLVMTGFQQLSGVVGRKLRGDTADSKTRGQKPGEHIQRSPRFSEQEHPGDAGSETSSEQNEPATEKAAEKISRGFLGRELDGKEKSVAGQFMHYGFGTAVGGAYGVLNEYVPGVSQGGGLPFGAGLMILSDELAVPAAGLSAPPHRKPLSTHLYGLAAHLVYGLSCEWMRAGLRRWLDGNPPGD